MTIMESTVGEIVKEFVKKGITNIIAEPDSKGQLVFTGRIDGKGDPVMVATLPDFATIRSPKFYIKRISIAATQTAKPDEPNWKVQNPFQKNMKVYALGVVPDATFKGEGKLQINVNGASFIEETDAGALTNLVDLNVPIPTSRGLELERSKPFEAYAWNPSGNVCNVTVAFMIGE